MHIIKQLQHPGWVGVVLPLLLAIASTFTPATLRAILLVLAVTAATWTFHYTELGGKKLKRTITAGLVLTALASLVFIMGRRSDQSARTVPAPSPQVTTTPVQPAPQPETGGIIRNNKLHDSGGFGLVNKEPKSTIEGNDVYRNKQGGILNDPPPPKKPGDKP